MEKDNNENEMLRTSHWEKYKEGVKELSKEVWKMSNGVRQIVTLDDLKMRLENVQKIQKNTIQWSLVMKKKYIVYGVLVKIRVCEKDTRKRRKDLYLADPTIDVNEPVVVSIKFGNYPSWYNGNSTHDLIRLTDVHYELAPDQSKMLIVSNINKNIEIFPNFRVDYDADLSPEQRLFTHTNLSPRDIQILRCIEDWYSHEILIKSSLSLLTHERDSESNQFKTLNYFNCLAAQVMGIQRMKDSICLTLFDDTQPPFKITNSFEKDHCSLATEFPHVYDNKNLIFNDINLNHEYGFDLIEELRQNNSKFVQINVWGENENKQYVQEIDKLDLNHGKDLIVIFNGEVILDGQNYKLQLPSNNFHHQHGRALKFVSRNSFLGKKLLDRIINSIFINHHVNDQ